MRISLFKKKIKLEQYTRNKIKNVHKSSQNIRICLDKRLGHSQHLLDPVCLFFHCKKRIILIKLRLAQEVQPQPPITESFKWNKVLLYKWNHTFFRFYSSSWRWRFLLHPPLFWSVATAQPPSYLQGNVWNRTHTPPPLPYLCLNTLYHNDWHSTFILHLHFSIRLY